MALTEHEFNLIVRFQLFDGERESFGHSQDWVGGTFELSGEMIQEPVGRPHRGGHQQRLGSGEVAIDRLSCHTESPGHVGDPHGRAAFVDDPVRGIQDALDRLLVGGGCFARPTMTAHAQRTANP